MPELPEVQAVVNYIRPLLVNLQIARIRNPNTYFKVFATHTKDELNNLVANQTIRDVFRRGKYILIQLDNGFLAVHLRMTGNFKSQLDRNDDMRHISAQFELNNGTSLYYKDYRKFGRIYYFFDLEFLETKLGCEPLSSDFDYYYLYNGLKRSKGVIKTKLLDQSFIAGLGNIYVDESLWRAKIHPLKKCNTISKQKIKQLAISIPQILQKAIDHNGTTIINFSFGNSSIGNYKDELDVFGRTGEECKRCYQCKIKKIFVAQRGTHFCSECQRV